MKLLEIENDNIILYRAMSQEEADKTLQDQIPTFNSRYKFFSQDLAFIKNRVKDGSFAHSNFKVEPYLVILKYIITNSSLRYFTTLNQKELMLDVRKLPIVKFIKIEELDYEELI